MKRIFPVFLYLFISCQNRQPVTETHIVRDTIIRHDTVFLENPAYKNWQEGFGLSHDPEKDSVWGKPVQYYLEDPNCSQLASDFYYGQMRPTDNGATAELLKYAYTGNSKLRPFYRWCLNKTILIQDGALADYTGVPARHYAEKFPKEFFEYMDTDTSGDKYKDWVNSILYSGFYDMDHYEKKEAVKRKFFTTMQGNCKGCNASVLKRIKQFTSDCFGRELK